jgi:hypothetical protein
MISSVRFNKPLLLAYSVLLACSIFPIDIASATTSTSTVFGLSIGQKFPRGLPVCPNEVRGFLGLGKSAKPKLQPTLCVGATEGGMDRQGVRRDGKYSFIPLLPSDSIFARELPALSKFMVGNHSFYAVIDEANVLQGIIITSTRIDGDNTQTVISMLTQRYNMNPADEIKTLSAGNGQIVRTIFWTWRMPNLVTRLGPPMGRPRASQVQILMLTPQYATELGL